METSTMLTGAALGIAIIIGAVEFIKGLADGEYRKSIIIFGATVVGFAISYFPEIGWTHLQGLLMGLSGSGAVTLAQSFGAKSDPNKLG
jgi:hypothetical protein